MDKIEKVKAEIERQKAQWRLGRSSEAKYRSEMLEDISSFIDSLEEEPASEDSHIKKSQEFQHDPESCKENGNSLACDDLERKAVGVGLRFRDELICDGVSREAAEIYAAIAQQKFMDGAKWQEEQFEKNRLASCDTQTREDAERELDFAMHTIKEEHRQPTYSDAINYGMKKMKEELMKDAIVTCMQEDDLGDLVPTIEDMSKKGFKHGDKVKVIIIKEEQI